MADGTHFIICLLYMHASFLLQGYRIDNQKYLTFETGLMMLKFICHDASHGQSAYEILHKIPDIMSFSMFFQVLNTLGEFPVMFYLHGRQDGI